MKIHDCNQGSRAWLKLRAGIPTASNFEKIMTPGGKKGIPKASSSADGYMNHLLAERILGRPIDGFQSQAMADGNRFESSAVAAFEFEHNVTTEKIGFVTTDDGKIGCSPDRLIEEWPDDLLECKAPGSAAVHVGYLRAAAGASDDYKVQLQGQLWVCEKARVRIISYYAGMPDAVFCVERDDEFIKELSAHVRSFSRQLEEKAEEFMCLGWIKDNPEPEPDASWLDDSDLAWAHARFAQEAV